MNSILVTIGVVAGVVIGAYLATTVIIVGIGGWFLKQWDKK